MHLSSHLAYLQVANKVIQVKSPVHLLWLVWTTSVRFRSDCHIEELIDVILKQAHTQICNTALRGLTSQNPSTLTTSLLDTL